MKFGKVFTNLLEGTLPEWRDKFLSYKELKQKLKQVDVRSNKRLKLSEENEVITKEEIDFIQLLEAEIEKFNGFFVEKEEEYIIRLKELRDRASKSNEEFVKIRKEIVDFHGEMVLLENYSALNYTGLVKILKKYDKRTGALIRLPFIQKVLQQPFFTMDLLYKLVKECELMLDHLFPIDLPSPPHHLFPIDLPSPPNETGYMESLFMKSTVSALRALKEIRSGSSTVSAFSLPPLQSSVLEETWNKIPVVQQLAK